MFCIVFNKKKIINANIFIDIGFTNKKMAQIFSYVISSIKHLTV